MIDDTVPDAGNHAFDLVCECTHLHLEHRRGYGPCFAEDYSCGCSRFRIADGNALPAHHSEPPPGR